MSQSSSTLFDGYWKTDLPSDVGRISALPLQAGVSFVVTPHTVSITPRLAAPRRDERDGETTTYHTDGLPRPSGPSEPNHLVTAKWSTPWLLEIVYSSSRGVGASAHITYRLSNDGSTLTYTWESNDQASRQIFHR